ncbi:MAG: sarcosine oxidase [Proteobacteria bacterium]|nr:sarcosine oxidase [Pseudomonadota bacterium]
MALTDSKIALVDLSTLARSGIKGSQLRKWIDSNNYAVGEDSNHAYEQRDGVLIARLSPGELLLLSSPASPSISALTSVPDANYRCYPVRRHDSHYWFSLTGPRCPEMFAKLCAVDLSPDVFDNLSVAQTSVAKTSAIILRHDSKDMLCYYLLGDSSTMLYMWTCLVDAMKEFDGQVLNL